MTRIESDAIRGTCWVAQEPIAADAFFFTFDEVTMLPEPTYQSVQVGPGQHAWEKSLIYLNHSCAPNTYFDTGKMGLQALRDIAQGEEITFFYPSTEWDMDRPFACQCGSPRCLRMIRGAKHVLPDVLHGYRINPHILEALGPEAGVCAVPAPVG